jgi:hypothetical protein
VSEIAKRKAATGLAVVLALLAGLSGGATLRGQNSDRYERFKSGGYLNGLVWIAMGSEEKSTFFLGFDEGVRSGLARAEQRKWLKGEQEDKLLAELLVREHPGVDPTIEIDRIYKDDSNLRLPIISAYQVAKFRIDGATEDFIKMALERLRKDFAQ